MRIADVHAHIYPDKIEAKAVRAVVDFYHAGEASHTGAAEELKQAGAQIGVTRYLVHSVATKPEQVRNINDFIAGQCAQNPEFIGVGTMHAGFDDPVAELERIRAMGLKGIKLHPDFQKFNVDDRRMWPTYDYLESHGMFMITHTGDPRYEYSHSGRVANVAMMFPKLKIDAAHFGGWHCWERGRQYLTDFENVYVDTSSTFTFGGIEPVKLGLRAFDRKRILFGSDFPLGDHRKELDMLESLGLGDDFMEDILYNNFAEFCGEGL